MSIDNMLRGREYFGFVAQNMIGNDSFGTVYSTGPDSEYLIRHFRVPDDVLYNKYFSSDPSRLGSANVDYLMNIIINELNFIKSISSNQESPIAPIYDFSVFKNTDGIFDIVLLTKKMMSLNEYISLNGLRLNDVYVIGETVLDSAGYLHSNNIYHGKIDVDSIYIDETGRFKVFGYGFGTPEFYFKSFSGAGKIDVAGYDVVSSAMLIYRLLNGFKPIVSSSDGRICSADEILMSSSSDILPPRIAVQPISDIIMKEFAGNNYRYKDASSFFEVLCKAHEMTDNESLNLFVCSSEDMKSGMEYEKNQPYNIMNTINVSEIPFSDDSANAAGVPVSEEKTEKKSSKKLILILSLSIGIPLLLIIIGILMYFFVFNTTSEVVVNEEISVVLTENDVTLTEGDTYFITYADLENISEDELEFMSDDYDVATVDNSGNVTAIGSGLAYISVVNSSTGGTLAEICVTVNEKIKIDANYVNSILSKDTNGADFGVYVYDIAGNKEYVFNSSNYSLGSSALVTLPIMYTYGKLVENGEMNRNSLVDFEYTYSGRGNFKPDDDGRLIEANSLVISMLRYSDNNAMNSLMNYMSIYTIQDVMRDNGMNGTDVVRTLASNPNTELENKISARDAGQILREMIVDDAAPGRNFVMDYFKIADDIGNYGMGSVIPSNALFLNHNAITGEKYNEIAYVKSDSCEFIIVFISNNGKAQASANLCKEYAKYVYDSLSAE